MQTTTTFPSTQNDNKNKTYPTPITCSPYITSKSLEIDLEEEVTQEEGEEEERKK
eukprot:m.164419 g.164419  ORF g.164419 m.164419 type:complete len:55 (-) comp31340_c0_seq3:14-178(-)